MTGKKIAAVEYGDNSLAYLFDTITTKYNGSVKISENDARNKTNIMCKESYAQSLLDTYAAHWGGGTITKKDYAVGDSVLVFAKSYNKVSKIVYCEGVENHVSVAVPISDFIYDVMEITTDDHFGVLITKSNGGAYFGTCKNPVKYKEELMEAFNNNTWFNVKITELIRGGFCAMYKGTVKCFIPGSHVAANVVKDFESLIGTELPVMVDNYDYSSKMYVVSYKKYVRHSLSVRIADIKFGHKYTGTLTSNPTEYGLFIELENYFTGLLKKSDFVNYGETSKLYKAGDKIDVYVKNITEKNGAYRIMLTLNETSIDPDKLTWYKLKNSYEKKVVGFVYDKDTNRIAVALDDDEKVWISLQPDFDAKSLGKCDKIKIHEINVINYEVKFDFCK